MLHHPAPQADGPKATVITKNQVLSVNSIYFQYTTISLIWKSAWRQQGLHANFVLFIRNLQTLF